MRQTRLDKLQWPQHCSKLLIFLSITQFPKVGKTFPRVRNTFGVMMTLGVKNSQTWMIRIQKFLNVERYILMVTLFSAFLDEQFHCKKWTKKRIIWKSRNFLKKQTKLKWTDDGKKTCKQKFQHFFRNKKFYKRKLLDFKKASFGGKVL